MYKLDEKYIGKQIIINESIIGKIVHTGQEICKIVDNNGKTYRTIRCIDPMKVVCYNYKSNYTIQPDDIHKSIIEYIIANICEHVITLDGLCANCGEIVSIENRNKTHPSITDKQITVSYLDDLEIKVTPSVAFDLCSDNLEYMLVNNKLVLILDLDHTLIHAMPWSFKQTNPNIEETSFIDALNNFHSTVPQFEVDASTIKDHIYVNNKVAYYYDNYTSNALIWNIICLLESQIFKVVTQINSGDCTIEISTFFKIRPGTFKFLRDISKKFDLILYTAGDISHATAALKLLDIEQRFFKTVLTRSDLDKNNIKSLYKILPVGHELMVVIDDTKAAWKQDTAVLVSYPYVFSVVNTHFLLDSDETFSDFRTRAEKFAYSCYYPRIIREILLHQNALQYECNYEHISIPYTIGQLWKQNKIEENYALPLPFVIADTDCQLQCFYNVLKIAHNIFFDLVRHSMNEDSKSDKVRIPTLKKIIEVMALSVFKNVILYVPYCYDEYKKSFIYYLSITMGIKYANDLNSDIFTHVLLFDNMENEAEEFNDYVIINIDWILLGTVTYYRPIEKLFNNKAYRCIFDRVVIKEFKGSNFDNWPQYQGFNNSDLNSNYPLNSAVQQNQALYNINDRLNSIIDETSGMPDTNKLVNPNKRHYTNTFIDDLTEGSKKNLKCRTTQHISSEFCSDPRNYTEDLMTIDYSNWYRHHSFDLEVHLDYLLDTNCYLDKAFFANISENLEDTLLENIFC